MTTEQAQLLSALQQINQRLGDQQNQITQLQAAQTRVRGESELSGMVPTAQLVQDAIQMANAGNSSSSNSRDPGVTIDTRQIGKPEQFKSDPAEYSDWSFVFKAYMSCISTNYIGLFERIEASRVPMPNRLLDANDKALSAQLYYVLAMLVKGRALDIIQNSGPGEGVEAFRKLEETYHPKVASRFVGSLTLILSTRFSSDIESELELFERILEDMNKSLAKPSMMKSCWVWLSMDCKTIACVTTSSGTPAGSRRISWCVLSCWRLPELAGSSIRCRCPWRLVEYPRAKPKAKAKIKDQKVKENPMIKRAHHQRGRVKGRVDTRVRTPTKTKSATTAIVRGISRLIAVFESEMKRIKAARAASPKAMQPSPKKSPKVNHCQPRLIRMSWIHLLPVPLIPRSGFW